MKENKMVPATITAVELIFDLRAVTRTAGVRIKIEREDGSELKIFFDLVEVGAKFCYTCMDWRYREPAKEGFIQLCNMMLFLGVKQPKELEGCSLLLKESSMGIKIANPEHRRRCWEIHCNKEPN